MKTKMRPSAVSDEQMLRIQKSLEGLEYGTVVITVHDSNIVQIDRTEKHRFSLKKSRPSPDRANHNQKSV
ncbi:hypothetical protein ATH33_0404 [Thermoactinomyces vulgaris]|nr:hypothetical protein ATH33_0404 [Thermoactinomyces vulgaris]